MVWDEADYVKRLKSSAEHDKILDLIRKEVTKHSVIEAALEDYAVRPLGMAEALLDHLETSKERHATFGTAAPRNTALPADMLAKLLTLNRSDLDDVTLRKAKRKLIEGDA